MKDDGNFFGGQLSQYYVFCRYCHDNAVPWSELKGNLDYKDPNGGCCNSFDKSIKKLLTSIGNNNAMLQVKEDTFDTDSNQLNKWNNIGAKGIYYEYYNVLNSPQPFNSNPEVTIVKRTGNGDHPPKMADKFNSI